MILFLDFDGVLHPDAVYLVGGRPTLKAEGELFMWAGHLAKALEAAPWVRLVLSTSWVRHRGFRRTVEALPEALRGLVIGSTWHSRMDIEHFVAMSRYDQIQGYVDRAGLKAWLAIDDDARAWAPAERHRLVLTDPAAGVSAPATLAELQEKLAGGR